MKHNIHKTFRTSKATGEEINLMAQALGVTQAEILEPRMAAILLGSRTQR